MDAINTTTITQPISDSSDCRANTKIHNSIKVVAHTPDKITDSARQTKINQIYDLLKPKEILTL